MKTLMKTPPIISDLPEWVTKEPEKKDTLALINKGKVKKLITAMDIGIVSEKGFSNLVKQLTLGNECSIKGNYNYKTHMILDFLIHKIAIECKKLTADLIINKDEDGPYTIKDIQNACEESWEPIKVFATDKEIKETLGLKNIMSNREIAEAVVDCSELTFTGDICCYYNPVTKLLTSYDLKGADARLFGLIRKKTRHVSSRTGYQENAYSFRFVTIFSYILLANIMNGNLQIKPKEFYQLRAGLQNFLNYVLMWASTWKKPTIIDLDMLCKLFGIESKNVTDKQRYCEKNLDEVKKYIYWAPVPKSRGKNKRYRVWKKAMLLKPRELPEDINPKNTNF